MKRGLLYVSAGRVSNETLPMGWKSTFFLVTTWLFHRSFPLFPITNMFQLGWNHQHVFLEGKLIPTCVSFCSIIFVYRPQIPSGAGQPSHFFPWHYITKIYRSKISTTPPWNLVPEKVGKLPAGSRHLPPAIFQRKAVSTRECTIGIFCLMLADALMNLNIFP